MMHKLKEIRFYKKITQPLLASRTGINQSRISLIENNLVTPREREKEKISKALHVAVEEVFPNEWDVVHFVSKGGD